MLYFGAGTADGGLLLGALGDQSGTKVDKIGTHRLSVKRGAYLVTKCVKGKVGVAVEKKPVSKSALKIAK